jgi:Raf kinase inhibitor-like YbhB/YbcL family protein
MDNQGMQSKPAGPSNSGPFVLRSQAFEDGSAIPRRFTCDGDDVSPALEWSGVPAGSASLVLIVRDPDASDFIHWVAYDIPAEADGLPAAVSGTAGASPEGRNDFGKRGWGGPCPPGTHSYVFTLSALDGTLGLTGTPRAGEVDAAMTGHVLGQARLTGTYKRG